uniref:Uncharacterized protein n=1 Tax=Arundo donax TaxID=35708 RepID=A0A0A9D0A3_ARUDO
MYPTGETSALTKDEKLEVFRRKQNIMIQCRKNDEQVLMVKSRSSQGNSKGLLV